MPDLPVTVTLTSSGIPVAGQSFTLTCETTTTLASPSYLWFDDGGNLVGNVSSSLTLNPLLESSTGEYSCQVTAGSDESQRFGCGVTRVVVQGELMFHLYAIHCECRLCDFLPWSPVIYHLSLEGKTQGRSKVLRVVYKMA